MKRQEISLEALEAELDALLDQGWEIVGVDVVIDGEVVPSLEIDLGQDHEDPN